MNTTTPMNRSRDQIVFESIQMIFGIYLIPIVCIPGLISNMLCIVVFVRNSLQRFLTTEFLLYLAVWDTVKLSNDLLYSIVLIIQMFNQHFGRKLFLKLYRYCHYINTISTLCTAWFTLIVAIERYVSCGTGSQTRLIIQKNARRICHAIIVLSLIAALPVSFRYEVTPSTSFNQTIVNSSASIQLSKFGRSRYFRCYSVTIDLIRAIFPSFLLFYLNTRIAYLMSRMKTSRGTPVYRLTISLIVIIGCFICCYFPDALLSLILGVGYIDETYSKRAIREVTDFFVTVNSATNFAIYFSISSTFRRAMLRLLERRKKSYHPRTYEDIIQRRPLQNVPKPLLQPKDPV